MYDKIRKNAFPLLAAAIWGLAFVAQKNNTTGAFTFNMSRSAVAFVFLLIIVPVFTKGDFKHILSEKTSKETGSLWFGGILCGIALSAATFLQQLGLDSGTEAGKASFLTAMYIVIVPVFGIFLKKRVSLTVWAGIALAVVGLYLLCVREDFTISPSDLLIVACSIIFAAHIMLIDHFSTRCDGMKMSCIQFLTSAVVSGVFAFIFENPSWSVISENALAVLYLGVFSSDIAYTLQILAQKNANPALVTLLLSMESVFGVLFGALFLGESLTAREYLGCVIMLAAVVLAQIPVGEMIKKRKRRKADEPR